MNLLIGAFSVFMEFNDPWSLMIQGSFGLSPISLIISPFLTHYLLSVFFPSTLEIVCFSLFIKPLLLSLPHSRNIYLADPLLSHHNLILHLFVLMFECCLKHALFLEAFSQCTNYPVSQLAISKYMPYIFL